MQYVLGINAFHGDSSACLLCDGKLIAAAEEERFRRLKHWAGFPAMAIQYCLSEAGIDIKAVSHIAINQDQKAHFWKKIIYVLSAGPAFSVFLDRVLNKKKRASIESNLIEAGYLGFSGEIHSVEHHMAHLASAFYVSPFSDAVVVSVDGFGDFSSAAWGYGSGSLIKIDKRVYFPHSLGIFYQALTQWLGFLNYGDEYKVMGLAPYGEPIYKQQLKEIVSINDDGTYALNLDYFRHHNEKIFLEWVGGEPIIDKLYSQKLVALLGPVRDSTEKISQYHMDIARSVQALYEDALMNLLSVLHQKYGSDNLCLAGGCAMNSVANGKIYQNTGFKKVYIQSAAGDAGGAIGAAYSTWHKLGGKREFVMDHSYWGPSYSQKDIKDLLDRNYRALLTENFHIDEVGSELHLCKKVAQFIANGKVVGWFQGRMEWGPRALGNRSILGDPRRSDMKDILNLKIKRRESFRPFAPSILRESVSEWFETEDDVPFMMQVFKIKYDKLTLIPAVTHVDRSGRLQTVTVDTNSRYYNLIKAFEELTGIPIVLNTSFNENEPVVCTPQEALNCFLRTKMDILVLGDYVIERVESC